MKKMVLLAIVILLAFSFTAYAADVVPNEIKQPGTQPGDVSNLESPDKCDNCHGGYDITAEPAHNWRGSMMANAGRDPLFWATLAIAEQDFDGAGDLCIRCHSTAGWLAGRSTPTDGSGLGASDGDGVECDYCHKMTNPDNSEHIGVQFAPFLANNLDDPTWTLGDPVIGYYGSGMYALWGGSAKLGPYIDAEARHQFTKSSFHRSVDFCGTCHDVSNPAVGDLAPNNGAQDNTGVFADGTLGSPAEGKAAFNNFPYKYGVVERTFSEYKAGLLSQTLVSDFASLPADLKVQGGAIKVAYDSAIVAGTGGNYADGELRYFSCQTCHMRPVTGQGCNKNPPVREDLALHDLTGGNYWMPDAIQYLDAQGKLRLGGGLTDVQINALDDGKTRAMRQLSEAASLIVDVDTDTLKVVNLAGHKLISGYPEGRRMWLNAKWYDTNGNLLREDGAYGPLVDAENQPVTVINPADSLPAQVESILDLHDPNTTIYEAHYAMTKEWADKLMSFNSTHYGPIVLKYDRYTGNPAVTIAQLNASPAGTYNETFHFVLNNKVAKDNRIPPYGMSYDEAKLRNALPVPDTQYNGAPGGTYDYWDDVALNPPVGATYATIDLLYQPTSWEYVQFLYLANNGLNAFLANEGVYMLDAWLNNGMATPYVMASAEWGLTVIPPATPLVVDSLVTWSVDRKSNLVAPSSSFTPRDTVGIVAHTVDSGELPLSGSQVFMNITDPSGVEMTILQGFSDVDGNVVMTWNIPRKQATGTYTANVVDVINGGYQYNATVSVTLVSFTIQ